MSRVAFHLKVRQFEQLCSFELSWGQGQHLEARVPYPPTLTSLYQEWQRVYLSFYNTGLRGRAIAGGSFATPPVDWREKLIQAEAQLLEEFHTWLHQGELYKIRKKIAVGKRAAGEPVPIVELFLTCESLELARLPWETWEIGAEFATASQIPIVRKPLNIREATTNAGYHRRGKARILAILGDDPKKDKDDDTGLNFKEDKEAVESLSSVAEPTFIYWQSGQSIDEFKTRIVEAIAAEPGWDILFFAGHSNETKLTGGEIEIAPNVTLSLSEITEALKTAKERGLKFAIFNSCSGLSLANALIDLGLSQVLVMRERIHNQVAQAFLVQFIQHLGAFKDVSEALLETCQYLKKEELHFKYPSAYLVPSLFRHPDAPLFRLQPFGIKQKLKRWLPTRSETIVLSSLALLSWQLSVQGFLLERRVLTQAIYRQLTHQVPTNIIPPLLLLQIDDQSIIEARIKDPTPMDRRYLSKLVNKASALNAKVIGIDYLLDRPHEESDIALAQSVKKSVQKQASWLVFAADQDDTEKWVSASPEIASLNWSLQGDMNLFYSHERLMYMNLVPFKDNSSRNLPFSYLLALASRLTRCNESANLSTFYLTQSECDRLPQPQLRSPTDFLSQILSYLSKNKQDYTTIFSTRSHLHPITNFAYGWENKWLHPIIDFSIPPNQIYRRIPAWKFLKLPPNSPQFKQINQQVIMIAPGAYGDDPDASVEDEDVFSLPLAVSYWREQQNVSASRRFLTGGEVHAYMFHNLLKQRLVVPIPDLWMIGIAAVLGKGAAIALEKRQLLKRKQWIVLLIFSTTVYGLVCLQVYISEAILLPCIFPSVTLWIYILPRLVRKK